MSKFVVNMVDTYTRDVIETMDEFDTKEEAELYREECYDSFPEGAEVLELAGRGFTPPDEVDFEVDIIEK